MKATISQVVPSQPIGTTDAVTGIAGIPLGGRIDLTRVSGDATDDSFNHSLAEQAELDLGTRLVADGSTVAQVKLPETSGGGIIRGSIVGMSDGANTFSLLYRNSIAALNLFNTLDTNGTTEHDVTIDLFLEIEAIDGRVLTLENNAPLTFDGKFAITPAIIADNLSESNIALHNSGSAKYPGSSFQFRTGTLIQEPISALELSLIHI